MQSKFLHDIYLSVRLRGAAMVASTRPSRPPWAHVGMAQHAHSIEIATAWQRLRGECREAIGRSRRGTRLQAKCEQALKGVARLFRTYSTASASPLSTKSRLGLIAIVLSMPICPYQERSSEIGIIGARQIGGVVSPRWDMTAGELSQDCPIRSNITEAG